MKATQLPHGQFESAVFRLSTALAEGGYQAFNRLNTDDDFVRRTAKYMLSGAPEETPATGAITIAIATALLGKDKVFGPDQIREVTGVSVDDADVQAANVIPYKLETLMRCKDNWILVYGAPTTIGSIATWSRMQFGWIMPTDEVKDPPFKTDIPMSGWFLISRTPQDHIVDGNERCATLVEMYLALSLHKNASPRHFFFQRPAICHQTAQGGEIYFGLGSSFGKGRSEDGAYDYWAVKSDKVKDPGKFAVVLLPDNPPIK